MLVAVVQLIIIAAVGWVAGALLTRDRHEELGLAERALLAVVGFVAFCVALMVVHLITGGAAFGNAWPVPLAGFALVVYGVRRRWWPKRVPWRPLIAFAVLLAGLYVLPAVLGGTTVRTGDPPWHLGWTQQLLHGEPVPTGPAPEFARNAYPWGYHAVLATVVRLVPGSDPLHAHHALHFLFVAAIPLAAAALARRVRADAGWAAAGAASLIGGFGWVIARRPDFVLSPGSARYGADLVVASPNSVYELFPPALPRELGLILLGATGALLAAAAARADKRFGVLAGISGGLAGLVSVPMMLSALAWTPAAVVFAPQRARRAIAVAFVPVLLLFALWAGPVVADYVRHGGFVDVTPQLGVEWSLTDALASWGLLLPLGLAGIVLARRSRTLPALAAASVLLLGLATARSDLSWSLGGNETLLHQGRMWPPLHLLAAAFAGIALTWLYRRLASRPRLLALSGAGLLLVAAASPVLASLRLDDSITRGQGGFVYGAADLDEGSFVRRAAERLGAHDIVRVEGSDELAFLLWQFSGARLVDYDDPRLEENDLRIRYADLAREWQQRMAAGGFEPNWRVVRADAFGPGALYPSVVSGTFRGERWVLLTHP